MVVFGGPCGCDRMVVRFTLPKQSVPITTKVVSLNPVHVLDTTIKFVNDLH